MNELQGILDQNSRLEIQAQKLRDDAARLAKENMTLRLKQVDNDSLREEVTKLRNKVNTALNLADQYGGIDGSHHKTWLIDQIVRALAGDGYTQWVNLWEDGEDGPDTYSWDEGIAP